MALHLITGYAGTEHITSADQGAYNMGTFGEGEFVLDRGDKFEFTIASNNSIRLANGEALMQGRFIKLPQGTTETVTIDNGTSGMKRKDIIVLRYSKDSGTGVESVVLAVKKGTPSSGTPSDPSVTHGNITDGRDLVNEMSLYRVNLDGLNISSIDTLFSVKPTMLEYMENYQMPIATASVLGGIKKGNGLDVNANGVLSLSKASDAQLGGIKIGAGLSIDNDGILTARNDLELIIRLLYEQSYLRDGYTYWDEWAYTDQIKNNFLSKYQGFVLTTKLRYKSSGLVVTLPSLVGIGSPFTSLTGNNRYCIASSVAPYEMMKQEVVIGVSGSSVSTVKTILPKYTFTSSIYDNPSTKIIRIQTDIYKEGSNGANTDFDRVDEALYFIPKAGG